MIVHHYEHMYVIYAGAKCAFFGAFLDNPACSWKIVLLKQPNTCGLRRLIQRERRDRISRGGNLVGLFTGPIAGTSKLYEIAHEKSDTIRIPKHIFGKSKDVEYAWNQEDRTWREIGDNVQASKPGKQNEAMSHGIKLCIDTLIKMEEDEHQDRLHSTPELIRASRRSEVGSQSSRTHPNPLDSKNIRMKKKPEKDRVDYELPGLDPNHSHFIFVHNENYETLQQQEKHTNKLFGTETALRANIEHSMSDNGHLRR